MVLVDTSVWVSHLRSGNPRLETILNDGDVVCHPFIIGELFCGKIKNRKEVFSLLNCLPLVDVVDNAEIILFIEENKLMGQGLGLIDAHLLASGLLSEVSLWTLDRSLKHQASVLGIAYSEG